MDDRHVAWDAEVKERWGDTDAWATAPATWPGRPVAAAIRANATAPSWAGNTRAAAPVRGVWRPTTWTRSDPVDRETIVLVTAAVLTAAPVMAICVRIALKPVVDAIVRLREGFGGDTRVPDPRRLERIEAELDGLRDEVARLREVDEFHRSLAASARPAGLPPSGHA